MRFQSCRMHATVDSASYLLPRTPWVTYIIFERTLELWRGLIKEVRRYRFDDRSTTNKDRNLRCVLLQQNICFALAGIGSFSIPFELKADEGHTAACTWVRYET